MIIIALDEQGDFEGLYEKKGTGAPIFIGGLVFDDCDKKDEYQNERERIRCYLRGVCKSVNAPYPSGLHSNGKNNAQVKDVKTLITRTLPEFMKTGYSSEITQQECDYLKRLPKRQGKYYIFANIVCDDGRQKIREKESIISREDFAGNLYMHMAEDVVERLIFHNPFIDKIRHVHLDLATRRIVISGENVHRKSEQYLKLGYKEDKDPAHSAPGIRTFLLSNGDNYRTAIEREMQDTEKWNIQFDSIGARSIYYQHANEKGKMEFLFMADIICSILGFRLSSKTAGELIAEFKERADYYTGHKDNMIFAHDNVDIGFRKAWAKLEEKDYYHALSISYDTMHIQNPYVDYYKQIWFHLIEEKVKEQTSLLDYKIALERLLDMTRQNNLNQDKLVYIFDILEKMVGQISFRNAEEKAVIYKLYDAGVSAYCHIGQAKKAMAYFEKCKQYARYTDFETYIRTRNKLSVCLSDCHRFAEARKIAEENKTYYEELIPLKQLILNDDEQIFMAYGITCSQLGQTCAFMRDRKAEEIFKEALSQMPDSYSPNYLITASYLLHFYLDMGMQKEYEELAVIYFGGNTGLRKQLDYAIAEGKKGRQSIISLKFALYIYVRSVYQFYRKTTDRKMICKLVHTLEKDISKAGEKAQEQMKGHPWEIIYKYLALLALDIGETEEAGWFMEKAENAVNERGMIIDLICWFGRMEYAVNKGDLEGAEIILRNPPESMEAEHPIRKLIISPEDFSNIYEKLDKEYFTFMYR